MATVVVQKREGKNGLSYAVKYRDPVTGRKKHYKTFKRLRDAQQSANDLRAMLDTGDAPKQVFKMRPMTFSEVVREQVKDWEDQQAVGELGDVTVREYIYRARKLERAFGKVLMGQLSVEAIKEHRAAMAAEKSNVSANKDLQIIKQVIRKAIQLQAIKNDPSAGIKKLSEKAHERNRFLLPHELENLVISADTGRTRFYLLPLVLLGAEHGASRQECLSLKWEDLNFDFQGVGMIRFYRTKNCRERTEFLMPRTRQALLRWRNHLLHRRKRTKCKVVRDDHVFCHLNGKPMRRFDSSFKDACERAGIKDFHFHDLRHTFCSNLILAGAGLKDAKEMIGHADISMTDRYSHLTAQHKQIMQRRLAEHYGSTANCECGT